MNALVGLINAKKEVGDVKSTFKDLLERNHWLEQDKVAEARTTLNEIESEAARLHIVLDDHERHNKVQTKLT